ncbi:uncharacterized protein DNG_05158 [Cephalotrichum gorgonifer]|uniref:Uncharacterized protein n=1 Tax=Cephalotrichum gorgonifer TaxID=2041049 RepID=A0AAE8N087_9PEZI|nr:uncharacterized protein DNG_05158 [Cephalotrichum gorgonifer]
MKPNLFPVLLGVLFQVLLPVWAGSGQLKSRADRPRPIGIQLDSAPQVNFPQAEPGVQYLSYSAVIEYDEDMVRPVCALLDGDLSHPDYVSPYMQDCLIDTAENGHSSLHRTKSLCAEPNVVRLLQQDLGRPEIPTPNRILVVVSPDQDDDDESSEDEVNGIEPSRPIFMALPCTGANGKLGCDSTFAKKYRLAPIDTTARRDTSWPVAQYEFTTITNPRQSYQGTIELFYHDIGDVPEETIDQLLYTLLSAPALKAVTATYIQDSFKGSTQGIRSLDCPPPILSCTRYTDLQELHLHWDHLSLRRLSTLLHLPRNLEVLHLRFNSSRPLNCHDLVMDRFDAEGSMISQGAAVNYTGAAMHMNEALRPVAHSLRELAISFIVDVDRSPGIESCSDWLDFHWGHGGLREFEKLDFLRVPRNAWALSGMYIPVGNLDLPKSLRTLHLGGSLLIKRGGDAWFANSGYAMIPPGSLTVRGIGGSNFNRRSMLDATHGLSYLQVSPGPSVDSSLSVGRANAGRCRYVWLESSGLTIKPRIRRFFSSHSHACILFMSVSLPAEVARILRRKLSSFQ